MFFSNALKKTIYVCRYYTNDDGVAQYHPPVKYRVNCYNHLPASARVDVDRIGSSYSEYMQIVGDPKYLKDIYALDKVYVEVEPPLFHNTMAKTADFEVQGIPAKFPTTTKILLKRLTTEPPRG